MVSARNQADNMIHATEKSLAELGDEVEDSEKKDIEDAIAALKEAMSGDDKDAIEEKTAKLAEYSGKMAERVYAKKGGDAGGAADAAAEQASGAQQESSNAGADDVVDAEFEEVKEDNK
jgi:molecular chaperone DnaK